MRIIAELCKKAKNISKFLELFPKKYVLILPMPVKSYLKAVPSRKVDSLAGHSIRFFCLDRL